MAKKKEKLADQKIEKLANIRTETLKETTGKTWDQWIEFLNKAGAKHWTFQETVAHLGKKGKVQGWKRQWIAIGYEVATGKRMPGRSLKGDYSITVTRTIHIDHKKLWKFMASPEGIAMWLRPMSKFKLQIKHPYETDAGVFGEIRTMLANRRIRFTWQEGDWDRSTTVQMFLVPRKNGSTILCFMHEKLRDGRLREPLREYWSEIAEQVVSHAKTMV
ncbi:SRPBCC domain-containing protein [Bdellovibrio bacteriovorus]|uniref:SRPBCC family protein n=1 Tax=Bdellovibrio TaxID=958 RepID=UPI0035A91506